MCLARFVDAALVPPAYRCLDLLLALQGYTEGAQPLNWKQMIKDYVRKPDFYLDVSAETGEPKEAGWEALFGSDSDEEDGGDDESEFEEQEEESEEGSDDDVS